MSVRSIFAALAFMASAVCTGAATPFFCTDQGRRLQYVRTEADGGKVRWNHTMLIEKVTSMPDGSIEVEYSSEFRKPNGSRMYGGKIELSVKVLPSGDVLMDVGESMTSVFTNYLSGARVSSEGGETVLPENMEPGDILPDIHCLSRASKLSYRTDITDRRVAGKETIEVPAGRFDCIVVREHKVEKGPGRNRVTTGFTWYAKGYGMIRHDTYNASMELETSEVLKIVN